MSLDKLKQKKLFKWLKEQVGFYKTGLRLSVLAGLFSGLLIIIQAWLLANLLQLMIIETVQNTTIISLIIAFLVIVLLRALNNYWREKVNFSVGIRLRRHIRQQVLDRLEILGPAYLNQTTAGNWSTLLIEQIEDLQDFYARYLPQMKLAMMIPVMILIAIAPINWIAALILFITAPLIPIFMILVGMGAADVNRRHFLALGRLSGHFLDRLKSIETIKLFHQGQQQTKEIDQASENFRQRTMEVLRMAFMSSAVLEFFTSISIAIVAVYFGFSYLGELNFGDYGMGISLFAGFFALILAPEFFQPLRDLGSFYHAKAQAIAAADSIYKFLYKEQIVITNHPKKQFVFPLQQIIANDLVVLTNQGKPLLGPISFTLQANKRIALIGKSGVGKTTLINALLGFLPYRGSLTINGAELNSLDLAQWREQISWVGQNPYLPAETIRANILLANPLCDNDTLTKIINITHLDEFISYLPEGLDTSIGDDAIRLSLGQAQRIAVARALIKSSQLLILDEPTASLDKASADVVNQALAGAAQTRTVITITHHHDDLSHYDEIWQLSEQKLTVRSRIS
ncbi:MAG: cysteine/glutathione ABC transporter permease/ATP-binding protein CydD [Candidatus Schmidhempelia sp.]|nr:cysteine/glutathione ABC transporter permease/ATP-binding protein CydD [Candidatus Schmidhempelia sp.]